MFGPQGGIAFKITLPEGFNPETDRCLMVILIEGENHMITRRRKEVVNSAVTFFREVL